MNKSLLPVLIAVVLIVGFWFWKSHEMKDYVTKKINQIDHESNGKYVFKHGGIESKGFPFSTEVVLKYPSLTFNEGNVPEVFVDGDVVIGSNLQNTQFWLKTNGHTHLLLVNESDPKKIVSNQWIISGNQTLTVTPKDSSVFKSLPESLEQGDWKDILQQILEKGESTGKDLTIKAITYNEKISMTEAVSDESPEDILFIKDYHAAWQTNDLDNDLQKFVYKLDLSASSPEDQLDKSIPDVGLSKTTLEGKLTYDRNFPYTDPAGMLKSFQEKPFSFEISKLNSANNFDRSNTSLLINSKPTDSKKFDLHFNIKNDCKFSKEGYTVLLHKLDTIISKSKEQIPPEKQEEYERLPQFVKEIFPRYYELGNMNTNIDFDLSVSNDLIPMINHIDIKDFNWLTDLYGFKIDGAFDGPFQGFKGAAKITLLNYHHLIESVASYYNVVITSANKLLPNDIKTIPKQIPPSQVDNVLKFLRKISNTNSDSKDLTIIIKNDEQGLIVGKVPFNEFVLEANEMWDSVERDTKPDDAAEKREPLKFSDVPNVILPTPVSGK